MEIELPQLQTKEQFIGFEKIVLPIKYHLEELDRFLNEQVTLFEPELRDLVHYSLEHKGKRIRPMLVFFAGWNGEKEISPDLIKVAGLIELSHLATIIHDDILDEAIMRHNMPTISKKYGPKIAVLLGDALFAHAVMLAAEFKTGDVCYAISRSIRRVCAGEIQQTFQAGEDHYLLEDYYRIIDLKTAELFYVSCLLGARLGGYSEDYIDVVASFGREMGIAYQIYDDLVDILGNEDQIGKTLGTDFANGKHTLPTLILIERLSAKDRIEFLKKVKSNAMTIKELKEILLQYGVFEQAFTLLNKKIENAGLLIADYKQMPSFFYLSGIQDLIIDQAARLRQRVGL